MTHTNQQSENIPGFSIDPMVKPECRPFTLQRGGDRAMLFIHGLTGSPADFREYANAYFESGYDVFVPLWPGHGSHISILERLTYRELLIPFPPLFQFLRKKYARVHITALSYGSILAVELVLVHPSATLSLFAPAWYLTVEREKKLGWIKRFKMHHVRGRVSKEKLRTPGEGPANQLTYDEVALAPTVELHNRSAALRPRLSTLRIPVFHAHGERDETTPFHSNRVFLEGALPDYTFYHFEGGKHVLPMEPGHERLAEIHLEWLERHP